MTHILTNTLTALRNLFSVKQEQIIPSQSRTTKEGFSLVNFTATFNSLDYMNDKPFRACVSNVRASDGNISRSYHYLNYTDENAKYLHSLKAGDIVFFTEEYKLQTRGAK